MTVWFLVVCHNNKHAAHLVVPRPSLLQQETLQHGANIVNTLCCCAFIITVCYELLWLLYIVHNTKRRHIDGGSRRYPCLLTPQMWIVHILCKIHLFCTANAHCEPDPLSPYLPQWNILPYLTLSLSWIHVSQPFPPMSPIPPHSCFPLVQSHRCHHYC